MRHPYPLNHTHFQRRVLVILTILILFSVSCGMFGVDFDRMYNGEDSGVVINTPAGDQVTVQTYSATGHAETIYEISSVPSIKTNTCQDDLSDAEVKIYFTQTVPENAGFTRKLTPHEYYFTAEIHSALVSPWRNEQCVYAENKNEYELFAISGVYDLTQVELFPLYTSDTACPDAAKFVTGGTVIHLTYDCKKGHTTKHFSFDMPLQSTANQ